MGAIKRPALGQDELEVRVVVGQDRLHCRRDAAGAVVTGDTLSRGLERGLFPGVYLNQNNAYAYFQALDDLLRPGPTGTNVNDLWFGVMGG